MILLWFSSLLLYIVLVVLLTGRFQLLEIAGNPNQELISIVHNVKVGHLRMVQDIRLDTVAQRCLTFQQFAVFFIRFRVKVKFNQCVLM